VTWASKSGVPIKSIKKADNICRWGVEFNTAIFDEAIVKEGEEDERLYEDAAEVFGPDGYKLYKLSAWYDLKMAGHVGKYNIKIDNYVKTDLELVESILYITSNESVEATATAALFDVKLEVLVHANTDEPVAKTCVLQVVRDVQFEYSRESDTIKWLGYAHVKSNGGFTMKPPSGSFVDDHHYFSGKIKSSYKDGYIVRQEARDVVAGCEPDKYDVIVSLDKVLLGK
jgi:hypothetical protein